MRSIFEHGNFNGNGATATTTTAITSQYLASNEIKSSPTIRVSNIKNNINEVLPMEAPKLNKKLFGGVPLVGLVPNHKLKQFQQNQQKEQEEVEIPILESRDSNDARSLELLLLGIESENSPIKTQQVNSVKSSPPPSSLSSSSSSTSYQTRKRCQIRRPVPVVINESESDEESVGKRNDRKRDVSLIQVETNPSPEQCDEQNEQRLKRTKTLSFQDVGNVEKKSKIQSTSRGKCEKRKGTPYKSSNIQNNLEE